MKDRVNAECLKRNSNNGFSRAESMSEGVGGGGESLHSFVSAGVMILYFGVFWQEMSLSEAYSTFNY